MTDKKKKGAMSAAAGQEEDSLMQVNLFLILSF
jgi:hypothetical protein